MKIILSIYQSDRHLNEWHLSAAGAYFGLFLYVHHLIQVFSKMFTATHLRFVQLCSALLSLAQLLLCINLNSKVDSECGTEALLFDETILQILAKMHKCVLVQQPGLCYSRSLPTPLA